MMIYIIALSIAMGQGQKIMNPSPADIVAAVIAAEARGEGKKGMQCVAEVIRNRANGVNPLIVVTYPGHFSCLRKKSPEQLYVEMKDQEGFDDALKIAVNLMRHRITTNHTKFANHYERVGRIPKWAKGHKGIKIGRHVFYRL